jgi:hypothetical protein
MTTTRILFASYDASDDLRATNVVDRSFALG